MVVADGMLPIAGVRVETGVDSSRLSSSFSGTRLGEASRWGPIRMKTPLKSAGVPESAGNHKL